MQNITIFVFVVFLVIWVLSLVIKSMQDNTPNKPPQARARLQARSAAAAARNDDESAARPAPAPAQAPQRALNASRTSDNDRFRSEIDRLRQRRDARNAPAPAVSVPPTVTPVARPPVARRPVPPVVRPATPARTPARPPARIPDAVRPNFLAQIESAGGVAAQSSNSQPTQPSQPNFSVGPPQSPTGPRSGTIGGNTTPTVTTVVATQGTAGAVATKATLGTGKSADPTSIVALVQNLLSNPKSFGAAVLLTEILGPPVSQRKRVRRTARPDGTM